MLRAEPPVVEVEATVRQAARVMAESDADSVVIVQGGVPVGLVTEGDLVERVVAAGGDPDGPVMALVERPPIALRTDERLFDAMRTMMRDRIRRIVVVDADGGALRGLLTAEDVSHYRGLDPVATTERLERAQSVSELAALRADSNRRLYRLYHQGVHSEDLLDLVTEVDDQLKRRVLTTRRADAARGDRRRRLRRARGPGSRSGPPAAASRSCARGRTTASSTPTPTPPRPTGPRRTTRSWPSGSSRRSATCGYGDPENGIDASHQAFRQPLSAWQGAYDAWASGTDADASARAALCFDLRGLYGDDELADALCSTIAEHLPNARLSKVLAREGTRIDLPLSTFGRFEVDEVDGRTGLDLRTRAIQPVVRLARAIALDVGDLSSANTFDRLRHGRRERPPARRPRPRRSCPPFTTLVDLHLREQMQAAERGQRPTDLIDPDAMNKSQQNLLKETLKSVQTAQGVIRKHYNL